MASKVFKPIAMSITFFSLVVHHSLSHCIHENLIKSLLFVLVVAKHARSLIADLQVAEKTEMTTHDSQIWS